MEQNQKTRKALDRLEIVSCYLSGELDVTMFARLYNAGDIYRQLREETGSIEAEELDRWVDICMGVVEGPEERAWYLNIAGPKCGDNLVAEYSSKRALMKGWRDDAKEFIDSHGMTEADDWIPYFTVQEKDGEIRELPRCEICEAV